MGDPLSTATGVLTIAAAAGQIARAIFRLREFGEMPTRVYRLKNEVTDLEVVLRHVGHMLQQTRLTSQSEQTSLKQIISRTKSLLEELAKALERLAKACSQSRVRTLAKSTIWYRAKELVQSFEEDIKAVKSNLNVVLGVNNSCDIQHIILELRQVSVMASTAGQNQNSQALSLTQTLADQQNEIHARLDQQYHNLNSRLDALGQLVLKSSASSQEPAENSQFGGSGHDEPPTPAVRVRISQRTPCRNWCPCACHVRRQANMSLPGVMESLVGKLFIGYTGFPVLNKPCDFRGCKDRQDLTATMDYWFPWWFVSMNIRMQVKCLPSSGPQLQLSTIRRVPDNSQTIAYALQGNIDGLRYLFDKGRGSPRDVSDSRGYNLVRWALYGGMHRYETVQFLISQGAFIDNDSYDHVWDFLFRGKCSEKSAYELRCITEHGEGDWVEDQNFPLIHRIIFGLSSKKLATELEENPHAVYLTDAQGRTALDWAVARAQLEDVALLTSKGADPNSTDITGRTTVLHAVDSYSIPCLRLVLEAGGNPNPVPSRGTFRSSPLTAAGRSGISAMLKLLLDFDAEPNSRNPEGFTALDSVAQSQNAECALVLLEYGADLNAMSNNGRTPLTTAIMHNNHEVLKIFIEKCYEYIVAAARLRGPQLLPIIAEYADYETMSILASSNPLKVSYDLRPESLAATSRVLKGRRDYSDKLAMAFEELITIVQAKTSAAASLESALESGVYYSARSSVRSDLAEALSGLRSAEISDSDDSATGGGGNGSEGSLDEHDGPEKV
ncbi:hypothetical protein MBLNU230_g7117t1 [Neophaeotheca triangularis]